MGIIMQSIQLKMIQRNLGVFNKTVLVTTLMATFSIGNALANPSYVSSYVPSNQQAGEQVSTQTVPSLADILAQTQEPVIVAAAFALDNTIYQPLGSTTASRSNPTHHICWLAGNIPHQSTPKVQEIFVSPQPMQFNDPKATITSDGTTTTVLSNTVDYSDGYAYRCWQFDEQDPIGTYSVAVNINDIVFDPVSFAIAP